MGSVNVKLPNGLEQDMNDYIEHAGKHMNSSELVRDALREYLEEHQRQLSEYARERIQKAEHDIEAGRVHSKKEVMEHVGLTDEDLDAARQEEDY
jgi:Arc/MetJ-type ribon-helix-helix transcriptional regulator